MIDGCFDLSLVRGCKVVNLKGLATGHLEEKREIEEGKEEEKSGALAPPSSRGRGKKS